MAVSSALSRANRRLVGLSLFFALGSFTWGYNIGVLATLYVNPGFVKHLNKPTAAQKGLITAIYYLGTWTSYIFISHQLSDRLGRRYAALVGTLITCLGGAIMAGADGLGMMIIGRIISGVGNAIISTSVPLYQSEIAPAGKRGGLVVMNHIGMVAGLASAFWVGYAVSHWSGHTGFVSGWRLSVSIQFIPALFFVIGLPFLPETPRWLLEKQRTDEAQRTLVYLRASESHPEDIDEELASIKDNVEANASITQAPWHQLLTDKTLFSRLWRGALLQFMAQMCGATQIKYYLPTVFLALGLSKDMSLMAGGIESTLKIGCTIIEMLIVDKVGRRGTLLIGSTIMTVSMLINGTLPLAYPGNLNRASDYACVVFIFFFSFGYSVGFGPNAWVYGSEIFPTYIRARGLNICASAGAIGSIVVAQFFPVAIENIGSKAYYIFFCFNFVSLVIIAIFYPETKGRSLEDMDSLFGKLLNDTENSATRKVSNDQTEGGLEQHVVANAGKSDTRP